MGTRIIVESIKETPARLVYISSDSVYDGCKGGFQETDPVNPQNYYGFSKYRGEAEVLKKDESLIIRTNIFGWNIQKKYSIAEWILHELSNKKQIKGFSDAFFSSIYTFDLAKILDIAIEQNLTGLFNCGSSTSLSKYEFAIHIADCFNLDKYLIQPISIDDFNFRAKRGKNLTINVSKIENVLRNDLPTITESIEAFCRNFDNGIHKHNMNIIHNSKAL
jgi:dTDP-4-dehydrorhamnose reductase